jgi:hypothetical protein
MGILRKIAKNSCQNMEFPGQQASEKFVQLTFDFEASVFMTAEIDWSSTNVSFLFSSRDYIAPNCKQENNYEL